MLKNKFLHIITKPLSDYAEEFIKSNNVKENSVVILAEDGVYSKSIPVNDVFSLEGDAETRGINFKHKKISYDSLVQLIFEHDRIYIW